MISSRNARTVANLAAASALTALLGACGGGMSLSPMSSNSAPEAEPGAGPEMPATIRPDEIVGRWGLASFQNPNDRARTEAAAKGQCKQPYVIGAGQSGGVVMHLADQATPQELAPQGLTERQELYRSGRSYARRAGPRDRLVRRPRADHPLHRQGCRGPLRQHGLCPLRPAGVRRKRLIPSPSCPAKAGHPVRRGPRLIADVSGIPDHPPRRNCAQGG